MNSSYLLIVRWRGETAKQILFMGRKVMAISMKKQRTAKMSCVIVTACMMGSVLFAGCSNGGNSSSEVTGEISFPLENTVVLDYWMPLNTEVSKRTNTMADTELYKELEKRTNVKINFLHPPLGQHTEQFNLMVASDEMPDIFEYDMTLYKGGAQKALDDEIMISLNDKMEQYAPNLTKLLSENEEWDKNVKTDEGTYFTFPFVRGDARLRVYAGPMLRKDWLEELNLSVPETVDEWENVLTAFKEQKGASNPFSFVLQQFKDHEILSGAYGVSNDMFIDGEGDVQFGPIMPNYKTYLETVKRWFDKGLIDRDFASNDTAAVRTKLMTAKSGATTGGAGGMMGTLLDSMAGTDQKFDLVAAPYPVLNHGEKPMLGQLDPPAGQNAFISTSCKNTEIAMRFLDYGYSEEGNLLFNYGIDGDSYTVQDGVPTYTDKMMKNPEGLSVASALCTFIRATYNGPFVQNYRYIEQYSSRPQQQDAFAKWINTDADAHKIPITVSLTPEESERYAKIMTDVETYCGEMYLKFILGSESLDNFETYVQNVKNMGIEEAMKIEQAAVERYAAR